MKPVEDAAYAMAALSATLVLLRALVKKGLLTRDEAVRLILDEAVSQAVKQKRISNPEATRAANVRRC